MKTCVLLLASVIIQGIFSSKLPACMCLDWKVNKSSIILTCTIPNLKWAVALFNPLSKRIGYCLNPLPTTQCFAGFKNVSIYQNKMTTKTVFSITGRIDKRLNGNWTCKHGTNIESATVEVNLSIFTGRNTIKTDCWQLLLIWTITGFVLFYILSQLLICTFFSPCMRPFTENSRFTNLGSNIWKRRKYMFDKLTNSYTCLEGKKDVFKTAVERTCICLLMVLMIGIPVIVGIKEKGMCSGNTSFVLVGFVFGFIIRILRMNKRGTEKEQLFIKKCFSCNRKKEQDTTPKKQETGEIGKEEEDLLETSVV